MRIVSRLRDRIQGFLENRRSDEWTPGQDKSGCTQSDHGTEFCADLKLSG